MARDTPDRLPSSDFQNGRTKDGGTKQRRNILPDITR